MGTNEKSISGEKVTSDSGVTAHGVPYNGHNGEKYIQKISYKGKVYLRAIVVTLGGNVYKPSDTKEMSIISKLTNQDITTSLNGSVKFNGYGATNKIIFSQIKNNTYVFAMRFDLKDTKPLEIAKYHPTFYNPNNGKQIGIISCYDIPKPENIQGAVDVGPDVDGYGIALSPSLMKQLGLFDGDVVYFTE